jgi:prepilin-type N-terminal cleavage/methylation domain-containing protein
MIKFFKQKNRGFTIVETIVALFIFSISITAMMAVFSRGIQNISTVKTKLTATYLAQEGVEYIRNLRDNYIYFGGTNGWNNFITKISTCKTNSKGCYFNDQIDYGSPSPQAMISDLEISNCISLPQIFCRPLFYHSDTGIFNYISPGVGVSSFDRKIKIDYSFNDDPPNSAIKVTSTVCYKPGNCLNNTVSFSEYLYNLTPPPVP